MTPESSLPTQPSGSQRVKQIEEPPLNQLPLIEFEPVVDRSLPDSERLARVLSGDLDYHNYDTSYASHDFHAFPAKFPPQLPERFIRDLTETNDVVLDPMMGSGTTIVESILRGRNAVGFDIDPLARLITRVKCTPLNAVKASDAGKQVVAGAAARIADHPGELERVLSTRWEKKTQKFVDYWFAAKHNWNYLRCCWRLNR